MKKITAILLTLIISLQMTVVSAAGTPNLAVSTATAKAGEPVTITVSLTNCTEFSHVGVDIGYDSSVLSLTGVTESALSGVTFSKDKELTSNPYGMEWYAPENSTYNGVLVTMQFAVAEGADAGVYPITVSCVKGPANDYVDGVDCNFVFDWDTLEYTALNPTYTSGSITVEESAPAEPTLSATCTDGKNVAITATGVEAGGKFIAVLYNGNEMTDMVIEDAAASKTLTFPEGTGDKVKVMWWDGLTTLSPVATPVEISLGN